MVTPESQKINVSQNKKGKFITFEGIDGSGKTSLIKAVACELRKHNLDVLVTQEPGGTKLGQQLREIYLKTQEPVSALSEALLFAADRAQHVEFIIKPALEKGKIVISDRFADSTLAYQGAGRKIKPQILKQLIKIATSSLKPDLTILLDLPVEKAILRKSTQSEKSSLNRMDAEKKDFYERVRKAYLKLARKDPNRFRIISADNNFDEIRNKTLFLILDFLQK